MKCIKVVKQTNSYELGTIRRVDDKEADTKVNTGTWAFCPKSEWKALRKPVQTAKEEVSETVVELSIEEKRLARKKRKK
jgi:hypothetical protein